jgi:hypothetical protein
MFVAVEVADLQPRHLGPADTGRVEEFEESPVLANVYWPCANSRDFLRASWPGPWA